MTELLYCPACRAHQTARAPRADQPLHCPRCGGVLTPALGSAVTAQLPSAAPARRWPRSFSAVPVLRVGMARQLAPAGLFIGLLALVASSALVYGALRPRHQAPSAPVVPIVAATAPAAPDEPAMAATVLGPPPTFAVVVPAPVVVAEAPEPPAPKAQPAVITPVAAPHGPEQSGAVKGTGITLRRRDRLNDEELRKQLVRLPEVALDRPGDTWHARQLLSAARPKQPHPLALVLKDRPDLATLPMRMGDECQLGKEPAENLHVQSRLLRTVFTEASAPDGPAVALKAFPAIIDPRLDPDRLRERLGSHPELKKDFASTSGIPALMQMMVAESSGVRKVLVDQLQAVEHVSSTQALVRLALFDLNDEVRQRAVQALAQRPHEDSTPALLEGLRYPWAPVADHAAEALVALEARETVPELERLADLPNPALPFLDAEQRPMVREMVRINHMRNCLLCHAPSTAATDTLRARAPEPNQPVPPPFSVAYYDPTAANARFVRADATYLRQDFSVMQPVENAAPWPSNQRYDYLVRTRPTTVHDAPPRAVAEGETFPQREAIHHALRALGRE